MLEWRSGISDKARSLARAESRVWVKMLLGRQTRNKTIFSTDRIDGNFALISKFGLVLAASSMSDAISGCHPLLATHHDRLENITGWLYVGRLQNARHAG
jgi:hypothetical protein